MNVKAFSRHLDDTAGSVLRSLKNAKEGRRTTMLVKTQHEIAVLHPLLVEFGRALQVDDTLIKVRLAT